MLRKHPSKQSQLLKYTLLVPMVLAMLVYTSAEAQSTKTAELEDAQLYQSLRSELQNMVDEGATPYEISKMFSTYHENLEPSKEDYYRAYVGREHTAKKFLQMMRDQGVSEDKIKQAESELAPKYNYKGYLQFMKTSKGLKEWENKSGPGVIKQVVGDVENLTDQEQAHFDQSKNFVDSEKFLDFYKLILTDGNTTQVFENAKKSKRRAKGIPDLSSGELEVPFAVIEHTPKYPGCDSGDNAQDRHCMADMIRKHVQKNFNVKIAEDLKLEGRQKINVVFKISKTGKVTRVRARAVHPALELEAKRVIESLPQMLPGLHKGEAVIVPYSLPIIFQVKSDVSETTTTPLIEKLIAMRKHVEIQGNVSDNEQNGFDLLYQAVTGTEFSPALVEDVQTYTSIKTKTPLEQKITEVFEQIQVQGNISKYEEEALKGFLILVTDNGLKNPKLQEGMQRVEIPYAIVEEPPIFPGCESGDSQLKKDCTSRKISEFVLANFNTKVTDSLKLKGRLKILTVFTVTNKGLIERIKSRAPHPKLEQEASRVISMLPKMIPGKQKGNPVNVPYSLPIIFEISSDSKEKN